MQRRAVHLLVVDDVIEAARIQKTAGITKVIAGHQGPIEDLLGDIAMARWDLAAAQRSRGQAGPRWKQDNEVGPVGLEPTINAV